MLSSTVAVQVRLMETFAALSLITGAVNVTVKLGAKEKKHLLQKGSISMFTYH